MERRQRGQTLLEYLIVLVVIILAIATFAAGPLRTGIQNLFNQSGARISDSADKILLR